MASGTESVAHAAPPLSPSRNGSRQAPVPLLLACAFCGGVFWVGVAYPSLWMVADNEPPPTAATVLVELTKLIIAAVMGAIVTTVHGPAPRRRKPSLPVAHAHILFFVAGALILIIIGNSLARAFGAVGVASVVRFRTQMKDPKDAPGDVSGRHHVPVRAAVVARSPQSDRSRHLDS